MAKPRPFPEGCTESLKAELKRARAKGVPAHERVLCVRLRAALGLGAEQVATAIGWSVDGVRHVQALYLKEGEAMFRRPGRGGRRHNILTREEEKALLRRVRDEADPVSVIDFRTLHAEVEKAAGGRVPPSTVHRMLDRHGWGRQCLVLIPDRKSSAGAAGPAAPAETFARAIKPSGAWYPVSTGEDDAGPAS
jgi:transposase